MATEERDTERVTIRTYIPAYQRDEWEREANRLNMSRAEYVRTMVQAGRREFSFEVRQSTERNRGEDASGGFDPGVDSLRSRVLDVLQREGVCDWDELMSGVTGDLEEQVEETLDSLQRKNRIRYDGRRGGYTVIDDGE